MLYALPQTKSHFCNSKKEFNFLSLKVFVWMQLEGNLPALQEVWCHSPISASLLNQHQWILKDSDWDKETGKSFLLETLFCIGVQSSQSCPAPYESISAEL